MTQPLVAVLIPFYGEPAKLRLSLESLARDPFPHDVLIVDDGNAVPLEVPAEWHPRVTVVRQEENAGITRSLNNGLLHLLAAGYRYVARLDAGDRNVAGRLGRQAGYLEDNPACQMVGGYALITDGEQRPLYTYTAPCGYREILRALHRRCCFLHPAVMFRAAVFPQTGLYNQAFRYSEDYELFFRIASRFPVANVPQVVIEYSIHDDSLSTRKRKETLHAKMRIILAHFDPACLMSWCGVVETLAALCVSRRFSSGLGAARNRLAMLGQRLPLRRRQGGSEARV